MLREHTLVTWDVNGNIEIHEVVHPLNSFKWYVREGEYARVMAVASHYECECVNGRLERTALSAVHVLRNWSNS